MKITFDKKDVLCILNSEEAKKHIDKQGYFSSYLYPDLDNWHFGTLMGLSDEHAYLADYFYAYIEDEDCLFSYGLFIPADKVKEVKE